MLNQDLQQLLKIWGKDEITGEELTSLMGLREGAKESLFILPIDVQTRALALVMDSETKAKTQEMVHQFILTNVTKSDRFSDIANASFEMLENRVEEEIVDSKLNCFTSLFFQSATKEDFPHFKQMIDKIHTLDYCHEYFEAIGRFLGDQDSSIFKHSHEVLEILVEASQNVYPSKVKMMGDGFRYAIRNADFDENYSQYRDFILKLSHVNNRYPAKNLRKVLQNEDFIASTSHFKILDLFVKNWQEDNMEEVMPILYDCLNSNFITRINDEQLDYLLQKFDSIIQKKQAYSYLGALALLTHHDIAAAPCGLDVIKCVIEEMELDRNPERIYNLTHIFRKLHNRETLEFHLEEYKTLIKKAAALDSSCTRILNELIGQVPVEKQYEIMKTIVDKGEQCDSLTALFELGKCFKTLFENDSEENYESHEQMILEVSSFDDTGYFLSILTNMFKLPSVTTSENREEILKTMVKNMKEQKNRIIANELQKCLKTRTVTNSSREDYLKIEAGLNKLANIDQAELYLHDFTKFLAEMEGDLSVFDVCVDIACETKSTEITQKAITCCTIYADTLQDYPVDNFSEQVASAAQLGSNYLDILTSAVNTSSLQNSVHRSSLLSFLTDEMKEVREEEAMKLLLTALEQESITEASSDILPSYLSLLSRACCEDCFDKVIPLLQATELMKDESFGLSIFTTLVENCEVENKINAKKTGPYSCTEILDFLNTQPSEKDFTSKKLRKEMTKNVVK